ncbi:hypothetical protein [Geothermobacter ehrlichii]|uniref:hypothetical protein n=1 Tax=Geothermobacter ehrlichii TaxID=213224 RepID=UPI0011E6771F|nr:hypothetical protein [Geothermobacter ehrlichii]
MATGSQIFENYHEEILGCPWCGEKPEIVQSWSGFILECKNINICRVHPSTGWCENLDVAMSVWNDRNSS